MPLSAAAAPAAEHMGMTAHQLVVDGARDAVEIEPAALLGQPRVEHHLEQQISEFVSQLGRFTGLDGIDHLVRLSSVYGAMVAKVCTLLRAGWHRTH